MVFRVYIPIMRRVIFTKTENTTLIDVISTVSINEKFKNFKIS